MSCKSQKFWIFAVLMLAICCGFSCRSDKVDSVNSDQLYSEISYRVFSVKSGLSVYVLNTGHLPIRLSDLRDDPSVVDELGGPLYDAMIWTLKNQEIQYEVDAEALCVFILNEEENSILRGRYGEYVFRILRSDFSGIQRSP